MKRTAERQITKDNFGAENGESGSANATEGFEKAAPEVLRARRIVKVRRTAVPNKTAGAAQDKKPNPFAVISAAAASAADSTDTEKKPNSATPIPAAAAKVPDAAAEENSAPDAAVAPAEPASGGSKPPAMDAPVNGEIAPEKEPEEKKAEAPHGEEASKVNETAEAAAPTTTVESEPVDAATKATGSSDKDGSTVESGKKNDVAPVAGDASESGPPADRGKAEEAMANAVDDSVDAKSPVAASADTAGKTEVGAKSANVPALSNAKGTAIAAAEAEAKKDDKTVADGKAANAQPFTFGKSAPFVFGGSTGVGTTPFASFADAAAAEKTKAPFSFSVPTFSAAEKPAPVAATFGEAAASTVTQKYEETAVATGEEDEKEVFRSKSKVFALEDKAWKERGVGTFKMNVDTTNGRARLLMRTEATLRLTLNTPLFAEFKMARSGERGVTFRCVSSQKSFLARFPSRDEVAELEQAVEDWKKTV